MNPWESYRIRRDRRHQKRRERLLNKLQKAQAIEERRRREPGKAILDALGLEKVVTYREKQ